MSGRVSVAVLVAVLVATELALAPLPRAAAGTCPAYSAVNESGRITDSRINEVSGVVASRAHRRMLWIHEDSGNGPWVYAMRPNGALEAAIEVKGATNRDWEDMAWGMRRLWIGDIGDNARARSEIQVYWFGEPGLGRMSVGAKMVTLRYEDEAHNAEALVVDGRHKRLFVFEKLRPATSSRVYAADLRGLRSGDTLELKLVAHVPMQNVTAADVGVDGVVVKNNSFALLFPWSTTRVVRTLRRSTPCQVALPASEAVAFSLSGHRIYSIPEGREPAISYVARR
jgi:hypothetical protein